MNTNPQEIPQSGQHAPPPVVPSGEATEQQLQLAVAQGKAYGQALGAMDTLSGAQTQRFNDYDISVVVKESEGLYQVRDGELRWESPTDENAHVEVLVRDASDGRFLPGLPVYVTLYAPDGHQVGSHQQSFLWHPWLYHYGRNWTVPGEGDYRIHVRIDPPAFGRHDYKSGARYTQPAEVDFTVHIKPGQQLPPGSRSRGQ